MSDRLPMRFADRSARSATSPSVRVDRVPGQPSCFGTSGVGPGEPGLRRVPVRNARAACRLDFHPEGRLRQNPTRTSGAPSVCRSEIGPHAQLPPLRNRTCPRLQSCARLVARGRHGVRAGRECGPEDRVSGRAARGEDATMAYRMRRFARAAAVLGLLALAACSKGPRVQGRVVHGFSREALKGIVVRLETPEKSARTDGRGRFSIRLPKDYAGEVALTWMAEA